MKPGKISKSLFGCDILCSFYGQSWLGSHRDLLNATQTSPEAFQGQPFLFSKARSSYYYIRWPAENGRGDISPPLFKSFGMDTMSPVPSQPPTEARPGSPGSIRQGLRLQRYMVTQTFCKPTGIQARNRQCFHQAYIIIARCLRAHCFRYNTVLSCFLQIPW